MAFMGPSEKANVQPTLITRTAIITATDMNRIPMLRTCLNLSLEADQAITLQMPVIPVNPVVTVTPGTPLTPTGPTIGKKDLTKATNRGWLIDEVNTQRANDNQDVIIPLVINGTAAILSAIEATLAGLFTAAGFDQDAGLNDISEDDFAAVAQEFDTQNAPDDRRVAVLSASQIQAVAKISRFTEARMIGDGNAIRTGLVGMLKGFHVFQSNSIQVSSSKAQNMFYVAPPGAPLVQAVQDGFGAQGIAPDGSSMNATVSSLSYAIARIPNPRGPQLVINLPFGNVVFDYTTDDDTNNIRANSLFGVLAHKTEWLAKVQTNP